MTLIGRKDGFRAEKETNRRSHSTIGVLFSNNDSKNDEHNFVRGGRLWDDPLKMVSHGLSNKPTQIIVDLSKKGTLQKPSYLMVVD